MGQNSGLLSSLTDWNSTLAGYADSISSGVVMPIALTVLALFMVLELYNFTQTIAMNGGSTAFTIQQVALVMLKITLCRWAVLHSTEILNAMFEVAAMVTNGIAGYVGSGQVNTEVDIENAISALPGGIGNMPVAMELMVVSWMLRLVNIVINTIVAARFIELYVYALNKNQSRNHGISREILSRTFTASAGLFWCRCRAGHSDLLRLSAMASAGYSAGFLHCYGRSLTLSWAGLYQP